MRQFAVFTGAFAYEFRMQIRRRTLWITMSLFILFFIGIFARSPLSRIIQMMIHVPLLQVVVYWTQITNYVLPIAVGVMLADRLPRDRRTKVDELFMAMPGALSVRLAGKYLGSAVATILPVFAFYCIGVGFIVYETHNALAILLALVTFAVIALPGLLFVAAYSVACPAVLWVPLYQFLFVGYWFWGNFEIRSIPSLSYTILTPIGRYASQGIFGYNVFFESTTITPLMGVESIISLLFFAALILVILWQYMKWQQARQ